MGLQTQNRPITAEERTLIEWLLRNATRPSDEFLIQLDSLVVNAKCDCGCPTVHFAPGGESVAGKAERILADYLATVDGEDVGIILFQGGGHLSMLEVYSLAGIDKAFGLPNVEDIYPWEELAERDKRRL